LRGVRGTACTVTEDNYFTLYFIRLDNEESILAFDFGSDVNPHKPIVVEALWRSRKGGGWVKDAIGRSIFGRPVASVERNRPEEMGIYAQTVN
jgi:hypothetical protein